MLRIGKRRGGLAKNVRGNRQKQSKVVVEKKERQMHYINAKGILSSDNGMNLYRGCTHGCIYCDSRSKCYGFTHEFEDIEVKQNAPELLERALMSKKKKCMIGTGAMCDPYMHCEEQLKLTRKCIEIIERYEFGLAIQTKSNRVLRDLDLLKSINDHSKCVVQMTLTTYDEDLCKIIEPKVCTTKERFDTLMTLKREKIPTVVWLSPILPYINDTKENIEGLMEYCIEAGVKGIICFGMGVTLRDGDREYFFEALQKHFPGMMQKYMQEFGNAYNVESPNSRELMEYFKSQCIKHKILYKPNDVFSYLHEYESKYNQLSLFE